MNVHIPVPGRLPCWRLVDGLLSRRGNRTCGEAVLEERRERRERSERLAWAGRFTARMYAVGLVPRHLGTTLCMLKC